MTSLKKNNHSEKVILGLSGGVDSTAAALFLREKGYEVIGLYFDVTGDNEEGLARVKRTASELGIKLIIREVKDLFENKVVNNFCNEYMCGRTPNPCIVCNPNVKFRLLTEAADEEGAQYVATGHYAGTVFDEENGTWHIRCATNRKKDQSYMLYRLGQDVISRLLLPLNDIEDKEEAREMARKNSMNNAEAKDSQEICFIDSDDDYKNFLRRKGIECGEGDFIDTEGNVLGRHSGILNYTIGQRKGLGITLGKPAFVVDIDSDDNTVTLGDNSDLFRTEVRSSGNIIFGHDTEMDAAVGSEALHDIKRMFDGKPLMAKIRYGARPAEATAVIEEDGTVTATFREPQRAATPGQSIVFYRDDKVLGGGFII